MTRKPASRSPSSPRCTPRSRPVGLPPSTKPTARRCPAIDALAHALPHALIARFAGELAQIWPHGERLGLAVSGGPDSLALLLLAKAAIPERVEAATVDHGLRPESAREAAMVAELCAAYGIPHRILTVKVARGNLQDKARAARYAALGNWMAERGLSALATAHNADDQAETLLMRLNRGFGEDGHAGVRALSVVFCFF